MKRVNGDSDWRYRTALDGIRLGVRSHIGRRRENQDEIRLPDPREHRHGKGVLFAVADGMGGHPGASVVGRMACEGLGEYHGRKMAEAGRKRLAVLARHLAETVFRIDRRIRIAGGKDPALEEMGTTLSCLVLTERHAIVAHVGDSRIYRLRGNHLTCLTTDHTFVQDMIFEGEVAPEKAASHPLRHVLTRAVGTMEPLERVDTRIDPRRSGERYLLCTDGLYNVMEDEAITTLLGVGEDAERAAVDLVSTALENGARDNTTALVIIPGIMTPSWVTLNGKENEGGDGTHDDGQGGLRHEAVRHRGCDRRQMGPHRTDR